MKLLTLRFGEVDVQPMQVFEMTQPILGFLDTSFAVISDPQTEPVVWLQSTTSPQLCLAIAEASIVAPDYRLNVRPEDLSDVGLESPEDALLYCIIVLDADVSKIRANLKAPILLNPANGKGRQVILDDPDLPVQYFILEGHSSESNKEVADVSAHT